jgi:O-antigen/teichoic acid export membrane protein
VQSFHRALTMRRRVILASGWIMTSHAGSQILRLGSNLIMTRLLAPDLFGIMALATTIMAGLAMFSDIGLAPGIVQSRRGEDSGYLNTVWTVQILRGTLIWISGLVIAVALYLLVSFHLLPLSSVYSDPVLPWVVAVLSFNAFVDGFASTKIATASRQLAVGRVTLIELGSQVAGLAAMIVWALADRSIWAMVVGGFFSTLARVAFSHVFLPGESNRLHWSNEHFSEIFHFGKWIFLTSIMGFFALNGDRLLLGWLIDPAMLGLYAIAFFMIGALQDLFLRLSGHVAFPAFSEVVRERPFDLVHVYYKFRLPLDVAALLSTGLLFSSGHHLIDFLYDDRYRAAGHMLEILSIGIFEVRYSLAGQCFIAMGQPRLLAPILAVRLVALFGLLPVFFHFFGLEGALWIAGGYALLTLPLTFYFKLKRGLFDLRRELIVLPLLLVGYLLGLAINQWCMVLGWGG